ncbi:hypothetical protein Ddye_019467 [Dipteronia dyeriana]|uniref:Uncharacterized protein n=1 Tax=Dipteronia dyeriana TaxID=168575 RepID=A0AAD9TY46_9ROSI|nr:hypothetical protein Ddye_019467 [Dipteronia dyeriana]
MPDENDRLLERNVSIGFSFSNKPDNPLNLVDEDSDVGEKIDAVGEVQVKVVGLPSATPLSLESGAFPDSTINPQSINHLRDKYGIPMGVTLIIPHRSFDVYNPPAGMLPIHLTDFENGVKLPFHLILRRALNAFQLALLQLMPGFWRHLISFLVL